MSCILPLLLTLVIFVTQCASLSAPILRSAYMSDRFQSLADYNSSQTIVLLTEMDRQVLETKLASLTRRGDILDSENKTDVTKWLTASAHGLISAKELRYLLNLSVRAIVLGVGESGACDVLPLWRTFLHSARRAPIPTLTPAFFICNWTSEEVIGSVESGRHRIGIEWNSLLIWSERAPPLPAASLDARQTLKTKSKVVLCSGVWFNEPPWMRAWLQHTVQALSADHVHLYISESQFDSKSRRFLLQFANATSPNSTSITLDFVREPRLAAGQTVYYHSHVTMLNECVHRYASKGYDYAILLDTDDFLLLHETNDVHDVIESHTSKCQPACLVRWVPFFPRGAQCDEPIEWMLAHAMLNSSAPISNSKPIVSLKAALVVNPHWTDLPDLSEAARRLVKGDFVQSELLGGFVAHFRNHHCLN